MKRKLFFFSALALVCTNLACNPVSAKTGDEMMQDLIRIIFGG